jgi:hypothetical protein
MGLTTSQRNPKRFLEPLPYELTVVRPRQPLRDLNPFDSTFLILRRVGVSTGVVPTLFLELPPRVDLSDVPSLRLTRPLRKAYSCSVPFSASAILASHFNACLPSNFFRYHERRTITAILVPQ